MPRSKKTSNISKGSRLVISCPAKINRYLRVGPKDRRGYHSIDSEFQAIGLADTLTITLGGSGFEVEGMALPEDNTVTKALRLMREVADIPPVGFHLAKVIPAMAGLGGGSSDAAGLLRGLRQILPRDVPERDFYTVAKSVGADVPFFLIGGRAHAAGYGEILTSLSDRETEWVVLVHPGIECHTGEMFDELDRWREAGGQTVHGLKTADNDFLNVAPRPCLERLEELAQFNFSEVGLTGSGSVVYGLTHDRTVAENAASAITRFTTWVVPTLSREQSICSHFS